MKKIINLPFPGFYYSWYDQEIDHALESQSEAYIERDPRDISVTLKDKVEAIFHSNFNGDSYRKTVAKSYTKAFNAWFEDKYELDLELEFESMISPKYYNFETDRVFAYISEEKARALCDLARPKLDAEIKRRFTSRDGFISHYPNNLSDWPRYLSDWDHNQLGTLLTALFNTEEDADFEIFESLYEAVSHAVDEAIDWDGVDADIHNLLLEKAREAWEQERELEDAPYFPQGALNTADYVREYEKLNHLRS